MNPKKLLQTTSIWSLMTLVFAHGAYSQTVSTPIVGFQTVAVSPGASTLGFPLLNPDVIKTTATAVSGNVVSLSGESNVGTRLTAGTPYYVEIYSGSLKGDRFDVDTTATISSANGTVTLSSVSANNTMQVSSIGSNLNGASIALRQHVTLDQIRSSASPSLVGNNSASSADQIQFYNPATKSYSAYYLRGDGLNWRILGSTTNGFNNVVVPPGVGVFMQKRTAGTSLTSTGTVRQNDFARPYQQGLQLLAMPFPLDRSAGDFGASAAGGWTGNNTANSADQIQIFNSASKSYTTYFLRADGVNWRRSGSTTNEASDFQMLNAANAFFALRRSADSNNIIVNPIPN